MPEAQLQVHLSETQAPWFLYPHSAFDQLSWHHFAQSLLPWGLARTELVPEDQLARDKP